MEPDQKFSRLNDRASGTLKKILKGYKPFTKRAHDMSHGLHSDQARDCVSRRRGIAGIAAQGGDIANLDARDMPSPLAI